MTENPIQTEKISNSADLFVFFYKKRKIIALVAFVTIIISSIVSLMITPKYKAVVTLLPATSTSISKSLLSTTGVIKESLMKFGEEEESERLMQILNSDVIRNKIFNRFNLFKHYDIDPAGKYPYTYLTERFIGNYQVRRTKFMAIEIKVLDTDPQMAADIANYASLLLDSVMNSMYRERAMKAFQIVQNEYLEKEAQIKGIQDSLRKISYYGVNDYKSQSEVYNAALAKAISENNTSAIRSLENKIKTLEKYGSSYLYLTNLLEFETEKLSDLKAKFSEAKVDAEQDIPYKYVIDNAYKAERKSYPIRWLIVFSSTLSATFFSLLVLIVLNKTT